jgi:hypothetical protein
MNKALVDAFRRLDGLDERLRLAACSEEDLIALSAVKAEFARHTGRQVLQGYRDWRACGRPTNGASALLLPTHRKNEIETQPAHRRGG